MRKFIDIIREAAEQQLTLPEAIVQVRQAYNQRGIETRDIGDGECENFAHDVLEVWQGSTDEEGPDHQVVETLNFVDQDYDSGDVAGWDWVLLQNHWGISEPPAGYSKEVADLVAQHEPNHVWITSHGRHFDAESPQGEISFFDLGFFKRWLENCAKRT